MFRSALTGPLHLLMGLKSSQNTRLAFLAADRRMRLAQTSARNKKWHRKPAPRCGTFLDPLESVGAGPAGCRLPPGSASDESRCSLASDKQHGTGNTYEQVCQMCKSVQRGNNAKRQKSWNSGSVPPLQTQSCSSTVTGAFINILT